MISEKRSVNKQCVMKTERGLAWPTKILSLQTLSPRPIACLHDFHVTVSNNATNIRANLKTRRTTMSKLEAKLLRLQLKPDNNGTGATAQYCSSRTTTTTTTLATCSHTFRTWGVVPIARLPVKPCRCIAAIHHLLWW